MADQLLRLTLATTLAERRQPARANRGRPLVIATVAVGVALLAATAAGRLGAQPTVRA